VEVHLINLHLYAVAVVEAQDTMAAVVAATETARVNQVEAEEVLTSIPYW
jgi:hypothetical protein